MKTLIIALQKEGKLLPGSFEMVTAAQELGGEIISAVLADSAEPLANELAGRGGGKVLAVSHGSLANFNDQVYAAVCSELIAKHTPDVILAPAVNYGRALLARLAAKHGGSQVSDAIGLAVDGGKVVVTRPGFGGSVIAKVEKSGGSPFFITVRGKIFAESTGGSGEVVAETVADSCFESKMNVSEVRVEAGDAVSLNDADVIVSAGRGLKAAENIPMVEEFAKVLGAAVGASRAIVDAGWVPYSWQVGQTGKTVNPKLYFAVGISGAIQHLVGMRSSQTIVAINKDKDAPVFNVANYGIVGDALEILPALTAKFKAALGK
ncbi:MAG: electron transfer flavoprotein subunit alpha/FixB family protein [bacterium]